jgi:hypothetical protein
MATLRDAAMARRRYDWLCHGFATKPLFNRGDAGLAAMIRTSFEYGRAGLLLWPVGLAVLLGACGHNTSAEPPPPTPADAEINVLPANYKADILGAMHAYLNDPTGIHGAQIAPPALRDVAGHPRYVVCVRYVGKKRGGGDSDQKELGGVFVLGRFDHFMEKAQEACAGAAYAPFPELQRLPR